MNTTFFSFIFGTPEDSRGANLIGMSVLSPDVRLSSCLEKKMVLSKQNKR